MTSALFSLIFSILFFGATSGKIITAFMPARKAARESP